MINQIKTRDGLNALARYLSVAYDSVPPIRWHQVLIDLDTQNPPHPAQKMEALEHILNLARDVGESALPCLAQLVVATGSPPKKIDEIRADALHPVELSDKDFDLQSDMLLAPDRYLTQSTDSTLDDGQLEITRDDDGRLEIVFPPMHPGPEQGYVFLWTGPATGQPRALRHHWREQRDHLAAAQWTFNGDETVCPLEHALNSLTARSLPEARFLRHVIALPVAVLRRAAASGSPVRAWVDWPIFDSSPKLLANVALVGISGTDHYSIQRSVVVDQAGEAEVPLSKGSLKFWPHTVQYKAHSEYNNPNADNVIIPRRDEVQTAKPIEVVWDFDVVKQSLVVSGLTPCEKGELKIDLRLRRTKQLPGDTPTEWSGPAAMRWRAKASLMDDCGTPLNLGPDHIVTPVDIRTALQTLDPFPETLQLTNTKSEIDITPCLFTTKKGLRLGYRIRIGPTGPAQGGASKVALNVPAAVKKMLQQILQQDMPLSVELQDDH